jgi:opacity protein-like surface antigen
VAALCLAVSTPTLAQAQSLYIAAGPSIPIGDLGDIAGTGWMLAGGFTFDLGDNGLWAGAEGTYGRNGLDSSVAGHVSLLGIMAILGYTIPTESSIHPYVWGGAGILRGDISLDDFPDEGGDDSSFGFQAGVGTTFGHGNVRPLIEARLETAGSDKQFFALDAGATFGLGN